MNKTSSQSGFTLAEVIIVVAIVAILAGVVIGNLMPARDKADDTKRVSDLSQVQLALRLYQEANSSYPVHDLGEVIGEDAGITSELAPYMGNVPVDPRGPGNADFQYVYDSDFTCTEANQRVIYAKATDREKTGNFPETCTAAPAGSEPSDSTYIIIIR